MLYSDDLEKAEAQLVAIKDAQASVLSNVAYAELAELYIERAAGALTAKYRALIMAETNVCTLATLYLCLIRQVSK